MIQADWAKIGVTANIVTFEWGEFLRRRRAGEADVAMMGGTWDYPDPSELTASGSPATVSPTGATSSHWCNKQYDRPDPQGRRRHRSGRAGEALRAGAGGVPRRHARRDVRRRAGLHRACATTCRASSCTSSAASRSAASAWRSRERRRCNSRSPPGRKSRSTCAARIGIIVPIGSVEQHGPNGLIGTDHLAPSSSRRAWATRSVPGGADARLRHVAASSGLHRLGHACGRAR